ncbi:hypothetical protein PgNI_06568 [Pyricularia grisea]|uniref:Uncharacterized protein n=1 Tax=Pyricularia grisea TaxID=148305 RepID=A0A6P8B5I8_PYRGI|nr:hypothetical protein PgNI_06568 [Pyricularia grisea]TLD10399.1 hypothetical protein PgNI_06568 [Pyricularia grisea]
MILERFLLALQTVCSVQASSPFRAMSFVGGSWQTAAVRTLGRKCAINIELWSEKEMKALVEFNSEAATDASLQIPAAAPLNHKLRAPKTANLGRGSSCGVKNQPGRPLGVTRLTELMTFKSRSSTPCALTEDTRSLGCHSLGPASAAGSSDHAVGLPDVHHGRRKHRYRNRRVEHKIHNQATLRLNAGGQLNRRVRSVPPRRT